MHWLLVAAALAASPQAQDLFAQHAPRVVQVRVVGTSAADSRAAIGSGFFVSADGLLLTNFHVVASAAWRPHSYRLDVDPGRGHPVQTATLLDLDPVHDLAVLKVEGPSPDFFPLEDVTPPRGAPLYSLGNPRDVGLSIVEGTFNGVVEGALVEQYHFSGSLNGGVSGGPAIDAEGRVVGVNVASMGNQLSFLVPIRFARALLERVEQAGRRPLEDPASRITQAAVAHQDELSAELLAGPVPTTTLGRWRVPGRWLPRLRAWGGPVDEEEDQRRFDVTAFSVRAHASTYLRDGESTGALWVHHRLYTPRDGLGSVALYRRAGAPFFGTGVEDDSSAQDFHSPWRCTQRTVSQGGGRLRVATCLRAYLKLPGLYDLALHTMTFDDPRAVIVSEVELYGFSAANTQALAVRWLEGFAWTP